MSVPYRLLPRLKMAVRALLLDTPFLPGRIPPDADDEAGAAVPETPCPPEPILTCDSCPVCGHGERTLVCEYNRFITFERQPDSNAARYDYSLCHACGVVYAVRRPAGARYRWLLEHFEEALGRESDVPSAAKLTASAFDLSEKERQDIKRRAARGILVSDHLGLSRRDYLPALLTDRIANSGHVELLGSLLTLNAPRVLEIRSRAGSILAGLRRLYHADVAAMTMFENQRLIIEEAYGIPVAALVDYDQFSIPYAGTFDLIVANHMFTHAVRPGDFLRALRQHLAPDGHVYLYNEPNDAEFLSEGKSMFNTLNAFHLQAFDRLSLVRALGAHGFEVRFLTRFDGNFICLAQKKDVPLTWDGMNDAERSKRLDACLLARDAAVLMLPPSARGPFSAEWDEIVDRGFAAGIAEVGENGQPHVRRRRTSRGAR
ncbi:MAG: methyltransferase domain-containing protein [Vicinamibacterales bacterium]